MKNNPLVKCYRCEKHTNPMKFLDFIKSHPEKRGKIPVTHPERLVCEYCGWGLFA